MNETCQDAEDKEVLKNRAKKKRGRSSHSKKSNASTKTKNSKESELLNRKSKHKVPKGGIARAMDSQLQGPQLTAGYSEAESSSTNTIQEGILGLHLDGSNILDHQNPDFESCDAKSNGFAPCKELVVESVEEFRHLLYYNLGNFGEHFFCHGVTVLKLVACNLTALPSELDRLVNLKVINIRQNQLKELPESLGKLQHLNSLLAEYNCLACLPKSLKNLKSLSLLVVNDNLLRSLPDGFSQLGHIDTLDVSSNMLQSLPATFRSAETISRIYAQKNHLKSLPSWLGQVRNIQELHLGENQISAWSDFKIFGKVASKLQMLDLSENKLCKLSDSFDGLSELSCLNLGRNPFENQKRPWASGNFLTSLPYSFCQLRKVTLLSLDGNQLKSLPSNFSDLVSLRMINLVQNCLETLPDSFCQLQSLELCLLSKNCLQRLPENFGNLPLLNHLEVSDNKLKQLPATFKNLVKLTYLDLSNNRLLKEPDFLHLFTHLNYLNLHSNSFEHSAGDIVDPELSYAYVEETAESLGSGQFEDIESDDYESTRLIIDTETQSSSPDSNNKKVNTMTSTSVEMEPTTDSVSRVEEQNELKENQISESMSPPHRKHQQQSSQQVEDEGTDVEWELLNGFYNEDASNYQEQYLFLPSDLHCKNVSYNSVRFQSFPDQFEDAED